MRPGRIWITRARPGAEATAGRLTDLGFEPLVAPLIEVRPLRAEIDLSGVDALAFTSRNAVEAFAALTAQRALRVFAVGDATAAVAREVGFAHVRSADGDLVALAALIRVEAAGQTVLNAGAAEPAGDLATLVGAATTVRTQALYETVETAIASPKMWDAVLIHSPRAARALAGLAPQIAGKTALAISDAAAAPLAGLAFADVRTASRPTEDALLAALVQWRLTTLGNPGSGV